MLRPVTWSRSCCFFADQAIESWAHCAALSLVNFIAIGFLSWKLAWLWFLILPVVIILLI